MNKSKVSNTQLKILIKNSLTGLNNPKIVEKVGKIRDSVAKDKGRIVPCRSLAECMSRSIVFKQANEEPAPLPESEIDQTKSIIDKITSNGGTNAQFNNTNEFTKSK